MEAMVVAVIPARMASTRCPGKPLLDLCGKPMVQWVWEAATKAPNISDVFIATPDGEIVQAAEAFGAKAILTSFDHPTGTDRIAEVASKVEADAYVNVQGDEPLIQPETIAACADALTESGEQMASVYDFMDEREADDPAVVKVVTDNRDRALYFSRSRIPFERQQSGVQLKKHVGLYAYTRDALRRFSQWEPTPLERTEMLEQLRFLENGIAIQMKRAAATALAVDTPEQADIVRELLATGGNR